MGFGSTMSNPFGGGSTNESTGSGGFFSSFYQNVEDTYATAKANEEPGFWEKTLEGVGNFAATLAATKLQQAKNAGVTPVNVPQAFPPAGNQTQFPAENERRVGAPPAPKNDKMILLAAAGIGALLLLKK